MGDTLVSQQGDTLDAMLWRERSLGPDAIGPVLAANRGIAQLGAVLPAGTRVIVPASVTTSATAPVRDMVQLWED